MSPWSIILFALLLAAAAAVAWLPGRTGTDTDMGAGEPAPLTTIDRVAVGLFHFFGVGGLPLGLAVAVLLSTAAVAGLAIDAIAWLHLGRIYPAWFPANALASGLGVGLLSTRMLAASYESGPGPMPDR